MRNNDPGLTGIYEVSACVLWNSNKLTSDEKETAPKGDLQKYFRYNWINPSRWSVGVSPQGFFHEMHKRYSSNCCWVV